jgi:hypothetical protein
MADLPPAMPVLLSDVRADRSFVDFKLATRPAPQIAKPTDIVIRMEAAPINPSDIGVVFGAARVGEAVQTAPTCVSAPIPQQLARSFDTDQYGNTRQGQVACPWVPVCRARCRVRVPGAVRWRGTYV